jgi:hypothetical protein
MEQCAKSSLERFIYLYQFARCHIAEDGPIPRQENLSPRFSELGLSLVEECDVKSENL